MWLLVCVHLVKNGGDCDPSRRFDKVQCRRCAFVCVCVCSSVSRVVFFFSQLFLLELVVDVWLRGTLRVLLASAQLQPHTCSNVGSNTTPRRRFVTRRTQTSVDFFGVAQHVGLRYQ